ncbi:MAG: family 1 glycosylhydrolase [Chloroflexota bacterium]
MSIKAIQQFPQGFLWGCATAAHQVEGRNINDWSRWEQTPGHIFQNQRSSRACEWWDGRYLEDFDRAAEMHNNAHRFSVEWSRIEPEPGKWDEAALQHYRDMLTALHARGIIPMITLHHFTNPLWIAEHQGWLWDETPIHFEKYVRKVVSTLGDLCTLWCTINEPMVYATQGYSLGKWPPGLKSGRGFNQVTVNLVRGHAAAYHAIKELQPTSQVGYAMHHLGVSPMRPHFIHWPAAYLVDHFFNRTFTLAMVDGIVHLPGSRDVPMPQAKGALDWVGLQFYQQYNVGFTLTRPASFFITQHKPTDMPVGPGGWGGLNPDATYGHIEWLAKTLKKPVYITECGVPDPDDTVRPGYLIRSVRSVWRAANYGYTVGGFFFWSLMDNFEWTEGYDPHFSFGLYHTNFETQERTPRRSATLYGEICAKNGLSNEIVERYAPELLAEFFPGEAGLNDVKLKMR